MGEPNEATSDQDDVSFIRTDDMVCLQCSETGERVCLAAEGFGNRHCFLEPIANTNYPPEMPSCVFVIEQALSVRALQEMVTAESSDLKQQQQQQQQQQEQNEDQGAGTEESGANETNGADAPTQLSAIQLTSKGGGTAESSGLGGGNRTLLYGHAVLLRHLHSGMYLATLSICSSSDKLAFDVGLKGTRELGESCWWTVHPGSKQRSEGEKVRVGDDLILVSVATERYLHYTTTEQSVTPPMASASAAAMLSNAAGGLAKQAIVNASFHSTHWSIAPFGTGLSRMKNVGYVFGGQVLRLLHGGDECLTISAQQAGESGASPAQMIANSNSNNNANASVAPPGEGNLSRANSAVGRQQIDVIYEGGAVMNQARSLWRLDLIRTRWSGGFVQYSNAIRIRHITTGKYLGVNEQLQLCLLAKIEATVERTAFCLRLTKDDNKGNKGSDEGDEKDEEVIGVPMIKYADTSFFIQHMHSQMWLSYRSYETKKRGIGRVEEKQAILSAEGKMDDCLEFSRSQEEEAKTARVIRKCDALFSKFIKILDHVQQVALLEKDQMMSGEFGNDFNSLMFEMGSSSDQQQLGGEATGGRQLGKKRSSVATSAVAAAALSSIAPLFAQSTTATPPTDPRMSLAGLDQVSSGQQSPTNTSRRDFFGQSQQPMSSLFPYASQVEMSKCLEDLIDYFAPPEEGCDHEQEQNRLRALRNRQDLFQEEGILNLILDAIDKINLISGQGLLVLLLGEESSSTWEAITGYFYQLLAAIIKDNHTNCAQFAQSHRLNWLFSRLSNQQASEGTGMLDVLHCVLVDSPEALNMLKESHIKVLISLLEKHGRDPKVLNVLCSLCVSNGVAIRSSQNTITNHLLPGRNLLLQTRLVDHVASMRPNIYIARVEGSAMYHRWYYEVIVDHIEMINNLSPHLRVGWANTKGYAPYPGGGNYWGTNGVGDDFYSYGFDGQYLWTAGRPTLVRIPPTSTMTRQEVLNNQSVDYQNQQQALLDSYAKQQIEYVAGQSGYSTSENGYNNIQQQPQQPAAASDGLTSMANIDPFTHSPYLRLQKNDVIGCLIDLSVPTIQFTINGKQIFGFFKNFNVAQGGLFHPVISFSAKVSCRFLFGGNQGELHYRPPASFSPIVDVLLPNQEVGVESCFSFGDLAKQIVAGPQITPDCIPQTVMDLIYIPRVIETQSIELSTGLESLRDSLAENMHELWCMSRIEDGWIYGEEHDDQNRTHPYLAPFSMLPALGKKYKLELATQTIKIILGLGYRITPPNQQEQMDKQAGGGGVRVKTYRLPNMPYMQSNGYKPAPLDLSNSEISPKMNQLVELLAENIHNIWAAEKISLKWTYRRRDPMNELDDYNQNVDGRSCHLLPYKYVDDEIKLKNRQSALETVFTVLAYQYLIEPSSSRSGVDSVGAVNGAQMGDHSMTPLLQESGETGPAAGNSLMAPSPSGQHSPSGIRGSPNRPMSAAGLAASSTDPQSAQLSGYETILNNAPQIGLRHYRAEKTYAVHSGRWYYEVEICTLGHIQIGWANLNFPSCAPSLGCDENSWAFDCHTGRKVHGSNYESFGQIASLGDVIGCMLDLNDRTISYSLNGKLMLDYLGNEMAFSSSELGFHHHHQKRHLSANHHNHHYLQEGFVPAVSLDVNQRVRLSFGQDVEQLRFFTDYGLQEGYHPFCVNMHKPITLWYNKREPNFINLDDLNPQQVNIEVTRILPGSDSPPALKVAYKQFESQERANWEYLRLSLPVTIDSELLDETDKIAKMQEIQGQQLRIAYSKAREYSKEHGGSMLGIGQRGPHDHLGGVVRHPARLEQHMLQSGFSMADVKDLQRSYENTHTSGNDSAGTPNSPQGGSSSQLMNAFRNAGGAGTSSSQAQRRQQLVKTRSVDEQGSKGAQNLSRVGPSLAVPSFTEAQRMMAAERSSATLKPNLLKRRNTGFGLINARGSSNSLDNLNQQQQLGVDEHLQDVAAAASSADSNNTSVKRTKQSAFKSIFGSMKSHAQKRSNETRSQSLSRAIHLDSSDNSRLMIPKISIQNEQFGSSSNLAGGGSRSRSMSRSGSYSSLLGGIMGAGGGTNEPAEPSRGSSLVRRLSRVGLGGAPKPANLPQQQATQVTAPGAPYQTGGRVYEPGTSFDLQQLDQATLELIDEYYYGVRIFPGQEPSLVLCGWVTSHFKHETLGSLQDIQHAQIIQSTSLLTGQAEICERRECYLLNAGQLYKEMHPASSAAPSSTGGLDPTQAGSDGGANSASGGSGSGSGSGGAARSNRGMLIGCHIDSSSGVLAFTVDGKPTKYRMMLEPQTKLYPAIFFQATTGDCLQFELSRTPLSLPLSAAILNLTPKHVQPQCPPRLKVQTLHTSSWSRVPNVSLRPNSLKLSDARGWSMLADDPLAMLVVHIPEENRCLDVLELIEHERLLRFHSNTLILYGALCAQGNHKVAHIICSYVDQRQLLYAINSDYLSGDLRRGFADLLIALHLEFHAYGRHLTQNEFIVPISQELGQLYGGGGSSKPDARSGSDDQAATYAGLISSSLVHSFSRIECVSIRTEMNMSPVGFDLSSLTAGGSSDSTGAHLIKLLSTPHFPIGILKRLVFQALDEAVFKGNLPIRDLPGGSNENLFVPLLKLADKLLLIGCITNQELGWLLSLIDPETFPRLKSATPAVGEQVLDPVASIAEPTALSFLSLGANSPSSIWKPTILEQPNRQSMSGRGLLQMRKLDEHVKLIICHILHHLLDIQLRHRIESIMAFSVNFVGQLQTDQRRRYEEIKTSNLPSHLTARKTREFRCSPREQMRYILNFKNNSDSDDLSASPSSDQLRSTLKTLHSSLMKQIKVIIESSSMNQASNLDDTFSGSLDQFYAKHSGIRGDESSADSSAIFGSFAKLLRVMKLVKMSIMSPEELNMHSSSRDQHFQSSSGNNLTYLIGQGGGITELKFIKEIVKTIVKWAEESTIENKQLIREMFHLLLRCYNGVGELIEAMNNSYVVGEKSKQDVIELLQVLSKVRALLPVQMGPAEEEVMRDCLWTLVNNVVFFQHPDLIRILRVHENVMHVMMNTLNKRSRAAQSASSSSAGATLTAQQQQQQENAGTQVGFAGAQAQSVQNPTTGGRARTLSIPGTANSAAAGAVTTITQQQQAAAAAAELARRLQEEQQEDDISKMVVSCCRFLCFFCRSSAKNQKAMFEHLGFLLENSNILLSRPSLRGSTPLDVAYSSLMENHELVLALRESYLEKIAIYLSRCGLQSNQELIDKGYPDVGWDPVEGERYLDFLRFCVWVNGESVEENSNLVIRLLIRRPECLGPALRGEGPGLFAAIKDAIAMADSIHTQQQNERRQAQYELEMSQSGSNSIHSGGSKLAPGDKLDKQQQLALEQQQQAQQQFQQQQQQNQDEQQDEEDEDQINMGSAILNFYCALVDLLGRCAPDLLTIGQGKHESIRARSILKSLVPLQDLKSAISLKFSLINPQFANVGENELPFASTASSFMPNHKQSLVLFLERVYGIENQETFFSLLEEAFLPDMRAATMLEKCFVRPNSSSDPNSLQMNYQQQMQQMSGLGSIDMDSAAAAASTDNDDSPENEMTLALNRYLGNSAIPLLIRESHYFKNAENYANLLEPTLHTVYRLSKVKILTKGQRESVSDFLIALTREMQPSQLLKLLRKLTVDVAVLNESTTVALRLLTLHYERCSKYYGYSGSAQTSASGVFGTATEEERRLTMVLFTNIFDSLSLMDYDPELFENALPCLNALACALPPDYSLTESREAFTSPSLRPKVGVTNTPARGGGQSAVAAAAAAAAANQSVGPYIPQPVETHQVELNAELKQLAQRFSEHYHDAWANRKLDRDWNFGDQYSFKNKTHPRLKPYILLSQHERDRYIEPIEEAMKALIAMGWTVDRLEGQLQQQQQHQQAGNLSRTASRADIYSSSSMGGANLDPRQRRDLIANYNPQPVDTSNLSLSRELQLLAERSAENAHDLWARKTMEDWQMKMTATSGDYLRTPIMLHPMMVPYDLLTDKEKRKNRDRSQELLKYMLFEGYKVFRADEFAQMQQMPHLQQQRGRIGSRANAVELSIPQADSSSKRRFAYSILDKLLGYTDTVMVKLELLRPSSNFSRRSSFKQSDRDVKFFSKVVLPLIERYFTAHRDFFLSPSSGQPSGSTASGSGSAAQPTSGAGTSSTSDPGPSVSSNPSGGASPNQQAAGANPESELASSAANTARGSVGCASIKEKEMLANLFCKLAAILRNKLSVIGPDAKIFVRCQQVLTRALDARSLSEQSPDFIKTSMLTFFNKTAQDLSQCVFNLQMKRYNAVRGSTMRISSSLYHVHLALLPTLTALFDHLATSESGKYLLLDEIQSACQKILQNLYILGTRIQLTGSHLFSRKELERHRHSYGNCLAAFAAAFPIAFLEPELIRANRFSSLNTKRFLALGKTATVAPPVAAKRTNSEQNKQDNKQSTGNKDPKQKELQQPAPPVDYVSVLPSLEELLKLVNKFVQTGKGATIDGRAGQAIFSNPNGPGGGGISTSGSTGTPLVGGAARVTSVTVASSSLSPGQLGSDSSGTAQLVSSSSQSHHQQSSSALSGSGGGAARKGKGGGPNSGSRMIPADNEAAIIEVIVPLLCSYLPFWYTQGPEASSAARNMGAGPGSTSVCAKHLNDLLKDIINLIRKQVGVADSGSDSCSNSSNWMVTIAAHASQIIVDSTGDSDDLLADSFLPLSTKISQRAESIYHREELMRGYLKSAAEDTTAIEERIQEEFHVLVRDIYAFYPLLIKYVDFKKSSWLKKRANNLTLKQNSLANGDSTLEGEADAYQQLEEEQSKPEQLLFHQVATVFDIWSNSQYFRREEQNFISQHEIDNMALIMQASNRPGRTFFQKSDPTQSSSAGRKKNKRRAGEKRDRERQVASSLLVVALKRLLPIGMNLFEGRERELVQHVKERFLKKEPMSRIEEVVRLQLTQPYQLDPSDEFCWQHYLYSRLGAQPAHRARNGVGPRGAQQQQQSSQMSHHDSVEVYGGGVSQQQVSGQHQRFVIDGRIVARIVDMARVFYGLHIIDHPNLQEKTGHRSCVSTQRRRVVIACFRMTSLHSLPKHRAINIFLRSYCDTWLLEENFGQEKLIEDLTQTFEQAEMKMNGDESSVLRNDPLSQLIMTLSRQATTEHGSAALAGVMADSQGVDKLYLQFADIFRMSCGGDEEEEEEGGEGENGSEEAGEEDEPSGGGSGGDNASSSDDSGFADDDSNGTGSSGGSGGGGSGSTIHEQEMEKQRLLFQQSRLSDRGVAEMILLYISAFSRHQTASGAGSAVGGSSSGASGVGGGHNLSSQHTATILSTLKLGISILRGGNVEVQRRMLKHLKDKKDVGFFTSIQLLMNSCSVLDLDAFERNQKAEALGVRSEGQASEKNMYDAEFTCKLFRFFQLLCEGHNLEFQNYLRTQAGNTTTVNVVISTVDYLLRLQESIMDFYWHYSSKDIIDPSGTENFIKAITIAKQVFCTLTESIQGPCPQNQQALAHSRLWHAVGGFLFLFAHMQDKLSRNSSQLNLLIELLDLQKEMVIMMLSMLEGNVVNGTIGKQMVETLVESSGNVEIILKFFDMFLKLPRLTSSANFQEYDKTGSGWISATDLRKAMEQHKVYTPEETQYLLSCCEPNHDGMIDYREFIDRFHQPAKDIGFNVAVLLTNLAEHITNEPRLQRFLETASTVLNYFEPYLGRIEIMGSSKRIERVYFEIKESTLDQWAKPQIQESKRAFFYSIVTEGDGKEKLEAFVNFCEDTIFEMQHASNILGEDEQEPPTKADKYPFDAAAEGSGSGSTSSSGGGGGGGNESRYSILQGASGGAGSGSEGGVSRSSGLSPLVWLRLFATLLFLIFETAWIALNQLRPARVRRRLAVIRSMTYWQLVVASFKLSFNLTLGTTKLTCSAIYTVVMSIFRIMIGESSIVKDQQRQQVGPVGGTRPLKSDMDSISSGRGFKPLGTTEGTASVRTELVSAPSLMTASVADVSSTLDPSSESSSRERLNGNLTSNKFDHSANKKTTSGPGGASLNSGGESYMDMLAQSMLAQPGADLSPMSKQDDGDQSYLNEIGLMVDEETLISGTAGRKSARGRGIGFRLWQLTSYNSKIVSFLARNFYRIKLLALVTAFIINFILLFYKVAVWTEALTEPTSIAASSSLISLAKRSIAGIDEDEDESELGVSVEQTKNKKLESIERKLENSFANYKNRYGRTSEQADEEDDEEDEEEDDDEDEDEDKEIGGEEKHGDNVDAESSEEGEAKVEEDQEDDEDGEGETTDVVEWVVMEEKYYYLQPILTMLASIHSLFSLCMLIAYYHLKVPLVIFKREKEIARKLEFEGVYITEEPDSENWWNGHWDKLVISAPSFPVNYWDKFVKKRVREKYREQYDYESLSNLLGMEKHGSSSNSQRKQRGKLQSLLMSSWLANLIKLDWRYQLWKAGVTLSDQSFQYQLLYLIFSLAGHFNYFFFAAHLLDVAVGFKKLQTILQSVTHNGKQLVLTVMLLTIVVYIYTVIAFNFFRKFYVQGEDDGAEPKCHSMMTCFVYHLYQGVRAGGGIGDVIEAPDGDDYEVYRIIFDITFFFSVIIILLAIIQGLIIDAFGELRDQLLTVAADMESNCFICGSGKDVLDKVPRGFDTHVQKEHNLANYMFFLMHLINKPDTDYTGQETYVWELYQRRCWDFFPVGECFRTQSEEEADAKPSKE